MQEAHGALEKHRESLEENHTASLKAATTIHSLKVLLPVCAAVDLIDTIHLSELWKPPVISTDDVKLLSC